MHGDTSNGWLAVLLAVVGFSIVYFLHDEKIGGQLAIFIAFAMNIATLVIPRLFHLKMRVRKFSAAFLLGAIGAVVFF